jgi:hypothetical protein
VIAALVHDGRPEPGATITPRVALALSDAVTTGTG